jgi:hypothetical protein
MSTHGGDISPDLCAYCDSVLLRNIGGVEAWRVGSRFVCNEFCADGIPDELVAGATTRSRSVSDVAGAPGSFSAAIPEK